MKRLTTFMLILVAALASCSKNASDPTEKQVKKYVVSIGLGGEITGVSIGDLTKAESNDLYGIQVDSRDAGTTGEYSHYACGLFDTLEGLTITLLDGKEYRFQADLIKDGKERVFYLFNGYGSIFYRAGNQGGETPVGTDFIYAADQYFMRNQWADGEIYLSDGVGYFYPDVEHYYGELDGFVPGNSDSVTIGIKRMVFGLDVIAEDMTEGKLKIQLAGAPLKEIVYPETELEEVFSLPRVYNVWRTENYKETITVSFTLVKDNEEETLLASGEFDFYRNKKTTITVQTQSQNPTASVSVSLEDTPMGDGGSYEVGESGSSEIIVNP